MAGPYDHITRAAACRALLRLPFLAPSAKHDAPGHRVARRVLGGDDEEQVEPLAPRELLLRGG